MTTPLRVDLTIDEKLILRRHSSGIAPANPAQLDSWLRVVLDVAVPPRPIDPLNSSPMDYLCASFFQRSSPDLLVLASRGAGKTFYAAVATVLDLVFRPAIEVKILAGSLEQALRMHEHLRRFFERPHLASMLEGRFGSRKAVLLNGSSVEVLAQSDTSVRGTRPQKLRCDEVELFDPDVWRAAQFVTRSKRCGGEHTGALVRGSIEALSTMHRASGLMARLVAEARGPNPERTLFRWTAIDVLEPCPPERACAPCELWDECGGRAKRRPLDAGHFIIDDAIGMKRRADRASWATEMLCRTVRPRTAVFPEFDPALHVTDSDPPELETTETICGMDFGFRCPAAIVWAVRARDGLLRVVDERVESGVLLAVHIESILSGNPAHPGPLRDRPRALNKPRLIAVDPAGCQRSDQTGSSPVHELRRAGLDVRYRRASIDSGIRLIRARLAPAAGPPTILIHRRCAKLIEALRQYRYPDDPGAAAPVKDGHDHILDALRYLVISLDDSPDARVESYM